MPLISYYVIGTDERYKELSELLGMRFPVYARAPRKNEKGNVIFPMITKGNDSEILFALNSNHRAIGGKFSDEQKEHFQKNGIEYFEILKDKYYLLKNAEETAEAVLCAIISETREVLSRLSVLVIGFGNVGQEIAKVLFTNGADVFVHSHEGSMKRAEDEGFNIFDIKSRNIKMFDVIINTAEGEIFGEELIGRLSHDTLVFQVATGECGKAECFARNGIKVIPLPQLPARFSPVTDAEAIFRVLTAKEGERN